MSDETDAGAPHWRVCIFLPSGVIHAASWAKPQVHRDGLGRLIGISLDPVEGAPIADSPAFVRWGEVHGLSIRHVGAPTQPRPQRPAAVEPLSPELEARILAAIGHGKPDGSRFSKAAARAVVREHAPNRTDLQAQHLIEAWRQRGILRGGTRGAGLWVAGTLPPRKALAPNAQGRRRTPRRKAGATKAPPAAAPVLEAVRHAHAIEQASAKC